MIKRVAVGISYQGTTADNDECDRVSYSQSLLGLVFKTLDYD